jgi:prevent-host-death family protein
MILTATEFKANMGHYLDKLGEGDIVITRNGKRIAKLTDASKDKTDILRALTGILSPEATVEQAKEDRLRRHENTV